MIETFFLFQAASFAYILIYLLCFLIFISVVYWLLNSFCPEPIRRYAIAVVIVICAIALIYLLLSFSGASMPRFR